MVNDEGLESRMYNFLATAYFLFTLSLGNRLTNNWPKISSMSEKRLEPEFSYSQFWFLSTVFYHVLLSCLLILILIPILSIMPAISNLLGSANCGSSGGDDSGIGIGCTCMPLSQMQLCLHARTRACLHTTSMAQFWTGCGLAPGQGLGGGWGPLYYATIPL